MITDTCGHHCGIKDGLEGHCGCDECHPYAWSQGTIDAALSDEKAGAEHRHPGGPYGAQDGAQGA